MRIARERARTARHRRYLPPDKWEEKEKKPKAKKEDWPFIGHFQEECRGMKFVIAIRGDPKALKELPKAD